MTIQDLEEAYRQLHEQLLRGELDEEEFKAEVEQLRFKDAQGNQWKLGWYTGKWYRYEQGQWIQEQPRDQPVPDVTPPAGSVPTSTAPTPKRPSRGLVITLIVLLLVASAALIFGWIAGLWGQPEEAATPAAAVTATAPAVAPTAPAVAPTEVAAVPPAESPSPTAPASAVPSRTPVPTVTQGPLAASPSPTAPTVTPSEAALPSPSATAGPAASAVPTSRPQPTVTPALSGRIFFPVYDANPDRRTFDIYAVQLESGKREMVLGQASQPALSPNGQRLAYRSWNSSQRGILVLELTGGNPWLWIGFHEAGHPGWSPDNQNIVFSSQQEVDRLWRLYRTWGQDFDRVRREGGDIFGRVPAWSPDGRIIFWDCPVDKCGLYAIHADGTNQARLTMQEHDTAPAISPDGRSIAFMSSVDGNWEVFLTSSHPPGGQGNPEPTRLTKNGARDGLPAWSPDGRWLAFVTDREGAWAIWVMRPDGSEQHKLLDLGGPLEGEIANVPQGEQSGWTWESLAWGR